RYRRFSELSGACEQQREAVDGPRRRTRMYGREGAFMPGAERLDQRRRLARCADFANEDAIGTHAQGVRDEIGDPYAGPIRHRHREPVELPYRKAGPAYRRDDRIRPASVAHTRVDEWPLERQLASDASGDSVRELGDLVGSAKRDSGALQPARALAENVPRPVDEDVGHKGIVE